MAHAGNILIVEDDAAVREALATFLELQGYPVVSAEHGADALRRLRAGSDGVCLILLDLMMPVMNGWDFRKEQLKDPALAGIPVVVITADTTAAKRAADIGAVGYMLKPIDLDQLLAHVSRHC